MVAACDTFKQVSSATEPPCQVEGTTAVRERSAGGRLKDGCQQLSARPQLPHLGVTTAAATLAITAAFTRIAATSPDGRRWFRATRRQLQGRAEEVL
jgi:hypothetical protein